MKNENVNFLFHGTGNGDKAMLRQYIEAALSERPTIKRNEQSQACPSSKAFSVKEFHAVRLP